MLPSLGRLTVPTGTNRHSIEALERSVFEAERKWMNALKENLDNMVDTETLRESHQEYIMPQEQELLHDLGILAQRGDGTWSAEMWQDRKKYSEMFIAKDQKRRNLILYLLENPKVQLDKETRELLDHEVQCAIWRRREREARLGLENLNISTA